MFFKDIISIFAQNFNIMLNKEINVLIANAMKAKDTELLNVLRLIKSEFTKSEKDGNVLDEITESKILLKMVSQREDAIKQYMEGNRNDLVEKEQKELDIINTFVPKQPTEEELYEYTCSVITTYRAVQATSYVITMKDMKPILTLVQEKYPSANGKIVSKALQSFIKK